MQKRSLFSKILGFFTSEDESFSVEHATNIAATSKTAYDSFVEQEIAAHMKAVKEGNIEEVSATAEAFKTVVDETVFAAKATAPKAEKKSKWISFLEKAQAVVTTVVQIVCAVTTAVVAVRSAVQATKSPAPATAAT